MKPKPPSHVFLFGSMVNCYHCGEGLQVLPNGVDVVARLAKTFELQHRSCPLDVRGAKLFLKQHKKAGGTT